MGTYKIQIKDSAGHVVVHDVVAASETEARAKFNQEGFDLEGIISVEAIPQDDSQDDSSGPGFQEDIYQPVLDPNISLDMSFLRNEQTADSATRAKSANRLFVSFLLVIILLGLVSILTWQVMIKADRQPQPPQGYKEVIGEKLNSIDSSISSRTKAIGQLQNQVDSMVKTYKREKADLQSQEKMREKLVELLKQKKQWLVEVEALKLQKSQALMVLEFAKADELIHGIEVDQETLVDYEVLRNKYMTSNDAGISDFVDPDVDTREIMDEVDQLIGTH